MTAIEKIKSIQGVLGVIADGYFQAKSHAALDALKAMAETERREGAWTRGKASSFADPADITAFKRCKATGKSDMECFKVGDNGIGKWGDDTTADRPMCALPPEDWEPFGAGARGKKVRVIANGREVICELRDTMPRKKNIKNGAAIDLNPAAVKAIGLKPPIMVEASWKWA